MYFDWHCPDEWVACGCVKICQRRLHCDKMKTHIRYQNFGYYSSLDHGPVVLTKEIYIFPFNGLLLATHKCYFVFGSFLFHFEYHLFLISTISQAMLRESVTFVLVQIRKIVVIIWIRVGAFTVVRTDGAVIFWALFQLGKARVRIGRVIFFLVFFQLQLRNVVLIQLENVGIRNRLKFIVFSLVQI